MLEDIESEGHARVVLDLSHLSFADSAGVNVLIRAKQRADAEGREFVLWRPVEHVARVFAVIGLADWLTFDLPR